MKTTATNKGYFPTPKGTCFIKPSIVDLDQNGCSTGYLNGNSNPFMVVTDGDGFVECVMIETIMRTDGNCEDNRWKNVLDDFIEMDETHPPFEEKNECRRGYQAGIIYRIDKNRLYEDENLLLCSDGGLQTTKEEQATADEAKYLFANDRNSHYVDCFDDLKKELEKEEKQNSTTETEVEFESLLA